MYITIYCGGMPFNSKTIHERSLGGSETAAYYMAIELAKSGHKVTLFTNTDTNDEADGVRYLPAGPITDDCPMGEHFHYYSLNTPVDVLIIQRHPAAFLYPWASKINLLWLHDLAMKQSKDSIVGQLPFIDGILAVSEWHKQQIIDTWGLSPDIVFAIQNGVDLSMYDGDLYDEFGQWKRQGRPICESSKFKMIYSSRPERGLENLVCPDGIMEKLAQVDPKYHLYVCNYDNVTASMAGYYQYLYERCASLPNVTVLGHLTKQQLADTQRQMDLCVYPTAFEETSCITAMECAAAGLHLISSNCGALPETCRGLDAHLIDLMPNDTDYHGRELRVAGKVDIDEFVTAIVEFAGLGGGKANLKASSNFSWSVAPTMVQSIIYEILDASSSETAYAKQCLMNSDIYALKYIEETLPNNAITRAIRQELAECYEFINDKWAEHYEAYYQYEADRGVNYGAENLDGNQRFEFVSDLISSLPADSVVLDYGCAHGHYTINLAKRFPDKRFIGIDIAASNVEKARAWAAEDGFANVEFHQGAVEGDSIMLNGSEPIQLGTIDCVIAAEVLEHLESPARCVDALSKYLSQDGKMIITVPYGPWEAQGYHEHWPWRAHVHHLDRADLHELFGMHGGFNIVMVPAGQDKRGDLMGSYVAMFNKPTESSGAVNYRRKQQEAKPRQTLSLCMIANNAQQTIEKAIGSVIEIVDEVILGLDKTSTDETADRVAHLCRRWHVPLTIIPIESPTVTGFDAARNTTVEAACGDWILWLDSDEVLNNADGLARYLRNNQFNGYAIAQHHFSMQPVGVMKTDLPVRLFRNGKCVRFFGVVHEHPEQRLNEGVGHVINIPGSEIAHHGYQNEEVRRGRFQRNIDLLVRDREKYPDRKLGKFLWLRDLAQMSGFELQASGGRITDSIIKKARRGVDIYGELLTDDVTLKMLMDGLEFYSTLSQLLGNAIEINSNINGHIIKGWFHKKDHLEKLIDLTINDKVELHGKYG